MSTGFTSSGDRLAARVFLPRVMRTVICPAPLIILVFRDFLHFISVLVNHTPLIVCCFGFVFECYLLTHFVTHPPFGTRINITHDCYVPHSGKCVVRRGLCSAALGVVLNLIKGTGDRWADDATEVDGDVPEDDSNESEDELKATRQRLKRPRYVWHLRCHCLGPTNLLFLFTGAMTISSCSLVQSAKRGPILILPSATFSRRSRPRPPRKGPSTRPPLCIVPGYTMLVISIQIFFSSSRISYPPPIIERCCGQLSLL